MDSSTLLRSCFPVSAFYCCTRVTNMEATSAECLQSYPFLKSPESPAVIVWPNLTVPSGYFTDGGILAGDTLLLPMEFYCFPVSAFHCCTRVKNMETTPADCLQSYSFLRSPKAPAVIVWPNLSAPSVYFADGGILAGDTFLLPMGFYCFPVSAFNCCTAARTWRLLLQNASKAIRS
ncbi:uncharacterized protein LOC142803588 [Rhipicephalus microplus]|uniref:uncharacterized protein LOC142803588 n=1 Tax=Rhipicephalus microplus TaxID=6941 RepID=UPI003F6D8E47